jgi:hypothetical protein
VAKFNFNDIPDEFQHRLMAYGEMGEEKSWGVGKISVLLWRAYEMRPKEEQPAKMLYYRAIGYWAKGTPAPTVRMYHGVVYHTPPDVVAEYENTAKEPCFHMYKAMNAHCQEPIDYVNTIEAWAMHQAELGYAFVDVEGFRFWLNKKNGAPPLWQGRLRRAQRICEQLAGDNDCPGEVKSEASRFNYRTKAHLDHPPLP